MITKSGPTIIKEIDYDSLINKAKKEEFYGYTNNSQFEINDNLTDPTNITNYMKRLLNVIFREYVNKKERENLYEIYLLNIQQFMIKYELNVIYLDTEIYKAADVIFKKTVKDRAIIQENNLNQNPWIELLPGIIYENNNKQQKQLKKVQ